MIKREAFQVVGIEHRFSCASATDAGVPEICGFWSQAYKRVLLLSFYN